MGNLYTSQTISNYNTSPPPDDASATASNQVSWAKHKDKLADPIKDLTEDVNTEVSSAFGKLPFYTTRAVSSTATLLTTDDHKILSCTTTFTLTLLAAATAGNGFQVVVKNAGTGVITIDGNGSETIDGQLTIALNNQYDSVRLFCDGSNWLILTDKIDNALPQDFITGLLASINVTDSDHDVDVTVGECRDGDDSENIELTTAITKAIDGVWVVGTGQGGLDTGTVAADTLYYLWAIKRTDTDVTDVLISASATSPTMPTNYDKKRLFATLETDSSANILRVYGRGEVLQRVYIQDGAVATGTTTTPIDDTSPQITEGDQYMSGKFTARSAASKLRFEVTIFGSVSVGANVTVGLHRVGVNDALAVGAREFSQASALKDVCFTHEMIAPDAAEQEYTVRVGMGSAGTFTFNGSAGAARFNGLLASTLIIIELTP